jgi:hypothetical protein
LSGTSRELLPRLPAAAGAVNDDDALEALPPLAPSAAVTLLFHVELPLDELDMLLLPVTTMLLPRCWLPRPLPLSASLDARERDPWRLDSVCDCFRDALEL